MKISIKLKTDTHNSYPEGTLDIWQCSDNSKVLLQFSDDDREVTVSRYQLIAALRVLEDTSTSD